MSTPVGAKRFEDLGPQIQDLLKASTKEQTQEDLDLLARVTVRQLAGIYDMLAKGIPPDDILEFLKKGVTKINKTAAEIKAEKEAKMRSQLADAKDKRKEQLAKQAEDRKNEDIQQSKKNFNFFKSLEEKTKLDSEAKKALDAQRQAELERKIKEREARKAARKAAGCADFTDSEDEKEKEKAKSAPPPEEKRIIQVDKVVSKPKTAKGGRLEGVGEEEGDEIWGEGVGTAEQQQVRAAQFKKDFEAEALAKMTSKDAEAEMDSRRKEDEEMGMTPEECQTMNLERRNAWDNARRRLDDLRREQAKARDGQSVLLHHGNVGRFQNLARRAGMVARMPKAHQKDAEKLAAEHDKALGFSPIECEKKSLERKAHLDLAKRRIAADNDEAMAFWADAVVRKPWPEQQEEHKRMRRLDEQMDLSPAEADLAATERLRHVDMAFRRKQMEAIKVKDGDAAKEAWRVHARRADNLVRFPRKFHFVEDARLTVDDEAGFTPEQVQARKTERRNHMELAKQRLEGDLIPKFALKASFLQRLPRKVQQEEEARMRLDDEEMGLTPDDVRTLAKERKHEMDCALARLPDEDDEKAIGGDIPLFRIAAIRGDKLVRAKNIEQTKAESRMLKADEEMQIPPDERTDRTVDRARHLELALARFAPTEEELARQADEMMELPIAERKVAEERLRSKDLEARGGDEAHKRAADRARHLEMAILRHGDIVVQKPADKDAWKEKARDADLTVRNPKSVQATELARQREHDVADFGEPEAKTLEETRRQHLGLAEVRKNLAYIPRPSTWSSHVSRLPKKKQMIESARKARDEQAMDPAEAKEAAACRRFEMDMARRRVPGEKAEEGAIRGDLDKWRPEAIRADHIVLLPDAKQQAEEARAKKIDEELGYPPDERNAREEDRKNHVQLAKQRLLMAAERIVRMPADKQAEEEKRAKTDDEEMGLTPDEQKRMAELRRAFLEQAGKRVAAIADRLAKLPESEQTSDEAKARREDEEMGYSPEERAWREAHRAAMLDEAKKRLKGASDPTKKSSDEEMLEQELEKKTSAETQRGALDLPDELEEDFAKRADEIVRMPKDEQRKAMEADRVADSAIPGITSPEVIVRQAERQRHLDMAKLRKEDFDQQDDLDTPEKKDAWKAQARRGDMLVRKPVKYQEKEEEKMQLQDESLPEDEAAARAVDREMHKDMANERLTKCPLTKTSSQAQGLVRLPKAVQEASEDKSRRNDEEMGLEPDEIRLESAKRARELDMARRRLNDEMDDLKDEEKTPEELAQYRAMQVRADNLVRLPKSQQEEEEAKMMLDDEEAGFPKDECDHRAAERQMHIDMAEKRKQDKADERKGDEPTRRKTDEEMAGEQDEKKADEDYSSDLEDYALQLDEEDRAKRDDEEMMEIDEEMQKEADGLGITVEEMQLMLEEEYERAAADEEAEWVDESEMIDEDVLEKGIALELAEKAWEAELKRTNNGEEMAEDTAESKAADEEFVNDDEVQQELKEEMDKVKNEEEADWAEEEDHAEADEEAAADEDSDAKKVPAPYSINIKDVNNNGYLKPHFIVEKYNPNTKGIMGMTKQKRVWVVDFFEKKFSNMDSSGKVKKEHEASKLLQLEKNIMDPRRARLMFFDANHSYELVFQSAEERERFYECASAIRPAIRLWCPELCQEGVSNCTTTITGTTEADVGTEPGKKKGNMQKIGSETKEAKINASRQSWEKGNIWTGTWDLGGRAPPTGKSMSELEYWMPREKYDLYAVGVQGASYRKRENDWYNYVQGYLGKGYLTLATMSLWDILLIVLVKKKCLLKVTNVEGGTKPTSLQSVCGNKGGIAISVRYQETPLCFINCHLAAKSERTKMRNTNIKEVLEGIRLACKDTDMANQFHHTFLLGNLNYSIEEERAKVMGMIEEEDFDQILAKDQLTAAIKDNNLLGFKDCDEICFPPTYKYKAGTKQYEDDPNIVPSYCDRILVRSLPGKKMAAEIYATAEELALTEHMPVFATFCCEIQRPYISVFQAPVPPVKFVFASMEICDHVGAPLVRPQLVLWGNTFADGPSLSKPLKLKTANPTFAEGDLPQVVCHTHQTEYLKKQQILIVLRDHDKKGQNSAYRASAILMLDKLVDTLDTVHPISLPMLQFGKKVGMVRGSIKMVAQ